jgi:hypothetical protein
MWLPALLSEPAFHTLRLNGILPAYYVLMAVGIFTLMQWLGRILLKAKVGLRVARREVSPAGLVALLLVVLVSGGITVYDYFYRWANREEVYQAFDGQVVALAHQLVAADEVNVLIPFYLYTHASMRYLLNAHFQEKVFVPEAALNILPQQDPLTLLIPDYPPDDGQPPAFVWLSRSGSQPGVAYVSTVTRGTNWLDWQPEQIGVLKDERGYSLATEYHLETARILPFFVTAPPHKKSEVVWADNLNLVGYEFVPPIIRSEAEATTELYLSWQILSYTGLTEKLFLQLIDSQGNGVSQGEFDPISRKMYRWREDNLILEKYPLQFGPDLAAGLYFVRLGFFEPQTGERLPAYNLAGQTLGDAWIGGPLYVKSAEDDPTQPQYRLRANLGQEIELLGYSLRPTADENMSEIQLYWQTQAPPTKDYTAFVQLLDAQNQVVAQVDAQPLPGIYPTSRWQPGEIISERFVLPVAPTTLAQGELVTGMYDLATGVRLPVYDKQGTPLPDGMVQLSH